MSLFQLDVFGWQTTCLGCGSEFMQWGLEFRLMKFAKERKLLDRSPFCCAQCNYDWSERYASRKEAIKSEVVKWG